MEFDRLRTRHARVALHDVDHGRRGRVHNVLERGLVEVGVEVLVQEAVAHVELAVPLHIALRVHADPVHRPGAGADGLEAVRLREDPVGPVAARAPAERAHAVAVHDALVDQVVDARHDVLVAHREVVADDVRAVRVSVIARATVVGLEHGVARPRVHLRAVTAVEAEDVGRGGAPVDRDEERIARPLLVADRIDENASDHLPVRGAPVDLGLLPERRLAQLWVHVHELRPRRAVRYVVHARRGEHSGRGLRIAVADEEGTGVLIPGHRERGPLVGELPHRARLHVERVQLRRHLHAGVEVDRVRILRPEPDARTLVEVHAQLPERAPPVPDFADVDPVVGHGVARHLVRRGEGDPAAVGGEAEPALADLVVVGQALDPARRDLHEVEVRVQPLSRDVALIALRRAARDPDPAAVIGDRKVVDAVGRIVGQALLGGRLDLDAPQVREGRDRVPHVDRESLLAPLLLVLIERVGALRSRRGFRRARSPTGRPPPRRP